METQAKIKIPELLAPAGDQDALLAAVAAGADAVYLGGKLFNARRNARNFESDELEAAVELLHLHHKKIYVTANTLITDQELPAALDYLAELYNLGVDAVILQDLGLINLARRYLPKLELHASTQMTIHNREGLEFLKDLGIKRVVLARELKKQEVAELAQVGVELEVFMHGALCISYSGQCLMSSLIGGRSGNRGKCAQPCRLEYQLVDGQGKVQSTPGEYLLSPKDQALAALLPELLPAVASLKIEGRMKRPEYVYTVVKVYRHLLDKYAANPEGYQLEVDELKELEESFNRGFTTGYFGGNRNEQIVGTKRPNNRGVYLGRVMIVEPGKIQLKLEAPVAVDDQLEVWVSQGGRSAGIVRAILQQGETIKAGQAGASVVLSVEVQAYKGDRVFKVFSSRIHQELNAILTGENSLLKIACVASVSGALDTPLQLCFSDPAGNIGLATTKTVLQLARNRPLTREVLEEQLGRLGNTHFQLTKLQSELPEGLMMPLSELNQVRREALEKLIQARLCSKPRQPIKIPKLHYDLNQTKKLTRQSPNLSVWVSDLEGVAAIAPLRVQQIYVGGDELTGFHWNTKNYRVAIDLAHAAGVRLIVALPRINREGQRQAWEQAWQELQAAEPDGVLVSELGSLTLAKTGKLPIYLNYPMNIFNAAAVELGHNYAVKQIALSPELSLTQLSYLAQMETEINLECLIHGGLELMVSEYCPLGSWLNPQTPCSRPCQKNHYALRDRLGLDFPIYTDQFCRMHLYNSKELCLYGDLEKLRSLSKMIWRLELKTFSTSVAVAIVARYQRIIERITTKTVSLEREDLLQELKAIMGREITKGHYFRGVE